VIALGVLDQLSTVVLREHCMAEALQLLRPPGSLPAGTVGGGGGLQGGAGGAGAGAGGEACFEVVAAPPRERALSQEWGSDLLVPVQTTAADSSSSGGFEEVFFHVFTGGELEKLVVDSASKVAGLEVRIVWSAQQRSGGTHACVVRRVR
jgi:hypothetical protein